MSQTRSPITTHVLDIARGKAAAGVAVTLESQDAGGGGAWKELRRASTNADGRVEDLMAPGSKAPAGIYRLTFGIGPYFRAQGGESFYPHATIVFEIKNPAEHHHVPLLLSPYGYSTYRGT